ESMTGTSNEYVFEGWPGEIDRLDHVGESIHDLTDESMPRLLLDPQSSVERSRHNSETRSDPATQPVRLLRRDGDDIAANLFFQRCRRVESNDPALVEHKHAIASIALVDEMRRDQNRDCFFIAQLLQVHPEVVPCARIQSDGRLIQDQ